MPITQQCAGLAPTLIPTAKETSRISAWPLIALALGFVMAMLDVTVVNVALMHIQASLDISLAGLVWVVDGYTLTFAAFLLLGGAMANRYGARAAYMAGLCIFVSASLLCGLAPSGAALVGARLLQGVGAALFMPASLSLLNQAYPEDSARIKVLSLWSAIVSAAGATGPLVGGIVVAAVGWRFIFWLNIPIGLLGIMLGLRHLAPSPRHRQALGTTGHMLAIIGLAAFSFVMINGASYGWSSMAILGAAAMGIAAILLFAMREQRSATPVVPRDLSHNSRFAATNGIGFFINLGAYGQLFLISLYLQQERGADAWHTGIALLPLMAMFSIGSLLSGRISARRDTRTTMLAGLATAGIIFVGLTIFTARMPYALLIVLMAAANLGVGMAVPAMTVIMMQLAGQDHANIAAAALNANRQIGALVGVAVMGAAIHMQPDWSHGLPWMCGVVAIAYLVAVLIAARYISASAPGRAMNLQDRVARTPAPKFKT
ncbi:MFS transporter [Paralcaligenes ginsengisoli]